MAEIPKPIPTGLEVVDEELDFHYRVQTAIHLTALARQPDMNDVVNRMVSVRDESVGASEQDMAALMDQLHVQQSLAVRDFNLKLPDLRKPYFAHMRLKEDGKTKDILLGHQTFIDDKHSVTIIDWKSAPIARVYFNYREGESYYEKLPGRIAEGEVVFRRMVAFEKGALVRVASKSGSYFRSSDGSWRDDQFNYNPSLKGGAQSATRSFIGTRQSGRGDIDVASLLDVDQYKLMDSDPEDPLLILGGAGCGKTTVALHRLAKLHADDPKIYAQNRMSVIVPDIGLVMLSRKLLDSLGMQKVRVTSFDDFISYQGRHIIKSLPQKICQVTPAKVVRFKRHPVVLDLMDELVQRRVNHFADQIESELHFINDAKNKFIAITAPHLMAKISAFEKQILNEIDQQGDSKSRRSDSRQLEKCMTSLRRQLQNLNIDRKELYTSDDLLQQAVSRSNMQIDESVVKDVKRHTLRQFAEEDREKYSDIDREAKTTIDGRLLDEEPESDDVGGTIDVEDYPVFLMLLKKYFGEVHTEKGRLYEYSHLVLDEAQELAPIELQILGHTLNEHGSVTIAGDAAQQTDPATSFKTWSFVLEQLGLPTVDTNYLATNYRSPRPVAEFAHKILGDQAPDKMPEARREGAPVNITKFSDEGHAATVLYEALEDLMSEEPSASVAVICKDYDSKLKVYKTLENLPEARFIKDGRFTFTPGIDVTEVSMIKGLEFDYVVLPDLDLAHYPDRADARRVLHVAATRAMYQLWCFAEGYLSKIVPDEYLPDS